MSLKPFSFLKKNELGCHKSQAGFKTMIQQRMSGTLILLSPSIRVLVQVYAIMADVCGAGVGTRVSFMNAEQLLYRPRSYT